MKISTTRVAFSCAASLLMCGTMAHGQARPQADRSDAQEAVISAMTSAEGEEAELEEATNEQFPRSCFRRASPTGTKVARSKGSCWRKRILYWLVGKKWPITSMIDPPETGPDAGVMLEISGGAYRVKRRVAFSVVHVWLLRESLGVNAMPAQCEGTGGEVKLRSLSSR